MHRCRSPFLIPAFLAALLLAQSAAFAATSGLDTPSGITELPLSVNGVTGLELVSHGSGATQFTALGSGAPSVVTSGDVSSGGDISSAGYIMPGLAVSGTACATTGMIGHSATGTLLTCVNNVWRSAGTDFTACVKVGPAKKMSCSPIAGVISYPPPACPTGYQFAGLAEVDLWFYDCNEWDTDVHMQPYSLCCPG